MPDSDPVTVNVSEPATADIVLCQKGDLAMIADATEAGTSDVTYDLNNNGVQADEDDLRLLKNVSVGVAVLE